MKVKNQKAPIVTTFIAVVALSAMVTAFNANKPYADDDINYCETLVIRMTLEDAAAAISQGGEVAELVKSFNDYTESFLYAPVSYDEAKLLKPYLFDSPHCAH